MTANEVIESYVLDVAVLLPRKLRDDVAFELRALLAEGLKDLAEAVGRAADATMAVEFLRAFGRPADVAARYRPALTIIDPADGRTFLRAAGIGLALIWSLGLALQWSPDRHSGSDLLTALGQWWAGTVIPSLWWPGVLVTAFGAAGWARRHWPQTSRWQPRAGDGLSGGRATLALAVLGIAGAIYLLVDPRRVLDLVWAGQAAPAAYQALSYTEAFRRWPGPVLLVLVALNVPLLLAVLARGRWTPGLRQLELALGLATCAAMAWTALAGPVLKAPASDHMARVLLALLVVSSLLHFGLRHLRTVRPIAGN